MCPRGGSRAKERERGHGGWESDAEGETATLKKFVRIGSSKRFFEKSNDTSRAKSSHKRPAHALTVDMGKKSKRRVSTPTPFKGQIPAFITVAEQLPEVFRAHVVSKLPLEDALSLAQVSKFYNAAVWSAGSAKGVGTPNYPDASERIPYMFGLAAYNGNVPALRAFVEAGVDVNTMVPKKSHDDELERTCESAPRRILQELELLQLSDDDDPHPRTRMNLIKSLTDKARCIEEIGEPTHTALYVAVLYDKQACITFLIEAGADVNKAEMGGRFESPLHVAARRDHTITLGKLIRAGANLHVQDVMGASPAVNAVLMGCKTALVQLLTVGGPDIHDTNTHTISIAMSKQYKLRTFAHQTLQSAVKDADDAGEARVTSDRVLNALEIFDLVEDHEKNG